jgi:hypothetical protein
MPYVHDSNLGTKVFKAAVRDEVALGIKLNHAQRAVKHAAGNLLDGLAREYMRLHDVNDYSMALDTVMRAYPEVTQKYRHGGQS